MVSSCRDDFDTAGGEHVFALKHGILAGLVVCLMALSSARGQSVTYSASSGSLPQGEGWAYVDESGSNPPPFVADDALQETTTAGNQRWFRIDPAINLSATVVIQANLKILSSNFISNIGDGSSRSGYYFCVQDQSLRSYDIALSSDGFVVQQYFNARASRNLADGSFHIYRFVVQGSLASLSIDGQVVQSGIPPAPNGPAPIGKGCGTPGQILFGGSAGASRSITALKSFCYGSTVTSCGCQVNSCSLTFGSSGCVNLSYGVPGFPGFEPYMVANFTPPPDVTGTDPNTPAGTIAAYAQSCGFSNLNWQQVITNNPANPNPTETEITPRNPAPLVASGNIAYFGIPVPSAAGLCLSPLSWLGCSIIAPPTYYDPPSGSYTYLPLSDNPYPFYLPINYVINPGACQMEPLCPRPIPYVLSSDGKTLAFVDAPTENRLSGQTPATPTGNYMAFQTTLVGVSDQAVTGSVSCGPGDGRFCTPLFNWTWISTFNGNAGGINQTVSIYPIDPGSGTGGITVTSINGVQLPIPLLSSQISTTASGLVYSRVTQTFNGTVTMTNVSNVSIGGPLQIRFAGMPTDVTLINATGDLFEAPYTTIPAANGLAPGQSITVPLQFKNPSNATINFTPVIYSGSIN